MKRFVVWLATRYYLWHYRRARRRMRDIRRAMG